MEIEYVHFYVDDALAWRRWFVNRLGFWSAGGWQDGETHHERVCSGEVRFLLSSACCETSPVATYLAQHPPGVVDVALRVKDLATILQRAQALGAQLLSTSEAGEPGSWERKRFPWATLAGWGALRHTLVEAEPRSQLLAESSLPPNLRWPTPPTAESLVAFQRIDHVVLNVAAGALSKAVDWYGQLFQLRPRQSFHIQTRYSGLRSQVLVSDALESEGGHALQFPINEPESATSQIQDFLNHNRGPGVQHIALATQNLLPVVARLRQQQVKFLSVPPSYYRQLPQRHRFEQQGLGTDWSEIIAQQVLVDWHPERFEGPLLQIFTQPIFALPTFFFELIERRRPIGWPLNNIGSIAKENDVAVSPLPRGGCAEGFGEGNFQALFEAMEREQRSRELVPNLES